MQQIPRDARQLAQAIENRPASDAKDLGDFYLRHAVEVVHDRHRLTSF